MLKILLIEDDAGDAQIFCTVCKRSGFDGDIQVATDGTAGLELLYGTEHRYQANLVVLDLGLPGLSGHEVLSQIRAHSQQKQTPVVVLTSSDNPADREAALENGACFFLTKPFDFDGYTELGSKLVEKVFPEFKKQL